MKTRYLVTLAPVMLLAYLLGPGCTQDFDAFQACSFGEKVCASENRCASVADPASGCASEGCAPCDVPNAEATCEQGACGIGTCLGASDDCDGERENGCEVDRATDPLNCGACRNACAVPHATAACVGGDCAVGTCDPGWDDCDGALANGCEADLANSSGHCGDCDTSCDAPFSCQAGQCTLVCDQGTADCNNDPDDGCETPLGTDENCGSCNDACDLPNATASCGGTACVIESCDAGYDDCDGMDANGCEVDLDDNALHCGTCGNACPNGPNGTTVCNDGQCELNCVANFGDCDGDLANGCETSTTESDLHCGGCDQPCAIAGGAGECNGGVCEITACNPPFEDCDDDPSDGCETNTDTSAASCGACGAPCSFANATALCMAGQCALGPCNGDFEDCNDDAADGCEIDTDTNPMHCGQCGMQCPSGPNGTPACTNGTCGFTCDAGFGDCTPAAGCETNIATNVNHCGACGRACSDNHVASKSCSGGLCNSTCDLGWANCSMPAMGNDDGCEQGASGASDMNPNSNANCGGCGNSCNLQGGANNDFECDGGADDLYCGCNSQQECQGPGVNQNASCSNATGLCTCGPIFNQTQCKAGERCGLSGGNVGCSCNGGAGCGMDESCCQTPAGCKNLQTDPANCGACGHACAPGFVCSAGVCACDTDSACDAGGAGTCGPNGRCTCPAAMTACGLGERCQPGGQCG